MTRIRISLMAIVALVFSATSLAGTAVGAPPNRPPRPISITLDLSFVVGGAQECRIEDGFVPTILDGGGQVSHLGRVDLAGGGCANFTPGPNFGDLEDGFVRYTAANGDVLELDFLGSLGIDAMSGMFTGEGQLQIVGGTGRFASATGEIDWLITSGVLTGSGGEAPIVGDGWIVYDASDRR